MGTIDVRGTVVNGVESPSLSDLKTRKCSKEELQAALVQLIEIVNNNAYSAAIKNANDITFDI